ncbi:TonB-dependent receptor [Sphingobium sp.]|uniref:TonB-dependent receptor n=1 Tax=Sphingobium sp. TaxID=1912891 RepID=UPI003BB74D45
MKSGISALALGNALLCAATVSAQTTLPPQDQNAATIDEIVVTAQKRSQSINDVPLSITAASGLQLTQQGITDVQGLVKISPGFNAIDSGYGTPIYFLRGVGFFDSTLAAKPTVGVYIDEVPIPFSIMSSGASFDLERVEILKGPQGTLFGSNATGGAINYIAAKPTVSPEAGISLGYGRFNRFHAEGFVSGPLSDTLSGRLSVRHEGGSDWQRSYTRDATLGQRDFTQARAQMLWKPDASLRVSLTVNANKDNSDTQAAQLVVPFQQSTGYFDPRLVVYPSAPSNDRAADWGNTNPLRKDNWMVQTSGRIEYDVSNDITFTSISSYSRFKEDYGQDSDGTALQLTDLRIKGTIRSFSQEARMSGKFMNRGSWVVGGNYENSRAHELVNQYLKDQSSGHAFDRLGLPPISNVPQDSLTRYKSWALFGDTSVPVTSTLTLSGGARYTKTTVNFSACNKNSDNGSYGRGFEISFNLPPGTIGPDSCVTLGPGNVPTRFDGKLPEDNVSWRGAVEWKPARGQLLYASVSRGFKAGSYSTLPASYINQYAPVTQEQVTAYEVGFKSALFQRLLQLNGAVFYYDYTDKQLKGRAIVPIFGPLEALVNIPKSRIWGAEIQYTVNPMDGLRLTGGATYISTKVTGSFNNYTAFGRLVDFKDRAFPFTPKWQINSDAEYRWHASDALEAYVGTSYTFRSSTNGDFVPDPRLAIDSYGLLDLRAGIEKPSAGWRLGLFGTNVTNKYYWSTAVRRGDAVIRFAGMPVTYGVNFAINFK